MEDKMTKLPKELAARCRELGITTFTISFSGGSDEGYVEVNTSNPLVAGAEALLDDIQGWADETMCYNGAGDGNDYGDDYEYDLDTGTVSHSFWYTDRVDGDTTTTKKIK